LKDIFTVNKKQKEWLSELLKRHPDYEILKRSTIKLGRGDISLTLERTEWIYMGAVEVKYSGAYLPGLKWHYFNARLSRTGKLLSDLTYNSKVVSYPHCPLAPDWLTKSNLEEVKIQEGEQMNFPFHEAVLMVSQPPLLKGSFYRAKRWHRRKSERSPVTNCCRTPKTFQRELPFLKPKALVPDTKFVPLACIDGGFVQVPEYLIKLLEEANASLSEQADAASLYAIAGLKGAINFVEGLPLLRTIGINALPSVDRAQYWQRGN
jgi:hypothetical protein